MNKELKRLMAVRKAILKACETFGGTQMALAKALGVDRSLISMWMNGTGDVSFNKALQIEKLTGGTVKMEDLKPEVKKLRANK